MVPYAACRQQALNIVQQLVLSSGGDDDLATLLGLMHTAPSTAVELNTHILKVGIIVRSPVSYELVFRYRVICWFNICTVGL